LHQNPFCKKVQCQGTTSKDDLFFPRLKLALHYLPYILFPYSLHFRSSLGQWYWLGSFYSLLNPLFATGYKPLATSSENTA